MYDYVHPKVSVTESSKVLVCEGIKYFYALGGLFSIYGEHILKPIYFIKAM